MPAFFISQARIWDPPTPGHMILGLTPSAGAFVGLRARLVTWRAQRLREAAEGEAGRRLAAEVAHKGSGEVV